MRNLRLVALLLLVTFMIVPVAQAQNQDPIEDAMSTMLKFFGSTMGAGLYHTAAIHAPVGLCVGVSGAIATVPDEFKSLIGNDQIALGYLHGNLGLGGNLEVTGRILILFDVSGNLDVSGVGTSSEGNGNLFSLGLKYGLFQAPALPKLALHASGHYVTLPDEFDFGTVRGASLKLIASHSFAIFGLYVGGGIDYSRAKINDDFFIPDLAGKTFDETGLLFNVGIEAKIFPLIQVNAGLNFGEFNSYDLGVEIGIH